MTMNCPPTESLQPYGPPPTMPDLQPITWILTDATAGMRIQCLGLATAAGLTPFVTHIHPSLLLCALPSLGLLPGMAVRSEEHTSELQSLMRISDVVFCFAQKNN